MPRRRPMLWIMAAAAAANALLLLAACGSTASYDQKIDYLRTVAIRGSQMHATLLSEQEKPDQSRCTTAYGALTGTDHLAVNSNGAAMNGDYVPGDAPKDVGFSDPFNDTKVSQGYADQIKDFYVTSCVTGVPKQVNTPSTGPTAAPVSSAAAH